MKYFFLYLIRIYQKNKVSSSFLKIECVFEPSCSEYTKQAIIKYGLFNGIKLGFNRVKRCNSNFIIEKKIDELI
jgi:putative component of membrane protein insertase Oxa1/YidC/SpoIIIJ protein YidD